MRSKFLRMNGILIAGACAAVGGGASYLATSQSCTGDVTVMTGSHLHNTDNNNNNNNNKHANQQKTSTTMTSFCDIGVESPAHTW